VIVRLQAILPVIPTPVVADALDISAPQDGFCSICTVCVCRCHVRVMRDQQAIVGFVESYVEQNATIAQIEARLDALCALAGASVSVCGASVSVRFGCRSLLDSVRGVGQCVSAADHSVG
jgi:hypothetical protein